MHRFIHKDVSLLLSLRERRFSSDPLDLDRQRVDECLGRGILIREVLDLFVRVNDGRVVAVEESITKIGRASCRERV